MSSINSESLIAKFPGDQTAILKLIELMESGAGRREFSLKRIYDYTNFSSSLSLALVLNALVQQGAIKEIIRVETEAGGIEDFPSIQDVPKVIFDWRRGVDLVVQPENILSLYKLVKL